MRTISKLLFLSFLLTNLSYADTVLQVSKEYQVRFSTKDIVGLKVGSVVKFLNGKKLTGEGKVIKLTEKTGYAAIYKGKGKVAKGNKVIILEVFTGADKKTYVQRKLAVLGGIGHTNLGSLFTGRAIDPTGFDTFLGYKGEVNYRFNSKYAAFVGIDKHGASKSVDIPAAAFVSGATKVNGEISDIYIGGQYFFQRYPFVNSYAGLGFIPRTGLKASQSSGGTKYQFVYTGTGILVRGGKEWTFKGNWMISLNLDFRSYSLTTFEDHNSSTEYEMDASLTSLTSSILFGHLF